MALVSLSSGTLEPAFKKVCKTVLVGLGFVGRFLLRFILRIVPGGQGGGGGGQGWGVV